MKNVAVMVILVAIVVAAQGQAKSKYWVVETNENQKDRSVVRIYDEQNNLVSESHVDRMIDITNRKERKMLNRMLTAPVKAGTTVALSKTQSRKKTKKFDMEAPVNVE